MAIAPDHRNNPATPNILELAWGADRLFYGSDALSFGVPVVLPAQIPERLIVAAARAIGVQAFAVYQPGGTPDLPSIIFQSTGVTETEQFERGHLQSQDFLIIVRARCYADTIRNGRLERGVIQVTDDFYEALRRVAGSRYNGISGQWSDEFRPDLEYRERTFSVTLRR